MYKTIVSFEKTNKKSVFKWYQDDYDYYIINKETELLSSFLSG